MNLSFAAQLIIITIAGLLSLHLIVRFVRHRIFTDFLLLINLLLFTALFLLEILFLKWPLLDFFLATIIGVIGGLHLFRFLRFRS